MRNGRRPNAERIYQEIKRYRIISFDTLVKQNIIYLADIFEVVEKEYIKDVFCIKRVGMLCNIMMEGELLGSSFTNP